MATSESIDLSPVAHSTTPIQFSHQIHTALTHENFILWKSQVIPVIRGHGLLGFLDGSQPPPPQFTISSSGVQLLNPGFERWHQQDQLILAWLLSSISAFVLTQVVRCDTSASLWSTLNQIHSSQLLAKILDLKLQIQTIKKSGDTCSEFLQKLQLFADRLRSVGTDIPDHDLVLHALQGLGPDYDSFVTANTMRSTFPSMVEFAGLLLAHEARQLHHLRSSSSTTVHLTMKSADSSSSQSNPAAYYSNSKPRTSDRSSPNFNFTNQGRGRGHFTNRGRGRGRGRFNNQSAAPVSY